MAGGCQTSAEASPACDLKNPVQQELHCSGLFARLLCLLPLKLQLGKGLAIQDDAVEENQEREFFQNSHHFQTPLNRAEMEGPASVLCLRTCCIKHCKPLRVTENPPELGQSHPSRSCSCSHGMMNKGQSNTASKCALPIIPEYPGFQDIKLARSYVGIPAFNQIFQDLERGKHSSSQLKDFPRRPPLVHCSGSSRRRSLEGPPTTSTGFQDKPLQEYFNERLMELGNYGSKWSNRKTRAFAEQKQHPRGCGRRSSCSAVVVTGHGQGGEESCAPADRDSPKGVECYCQDKIQNVLKLYKSDCLDILTMHITAPLEAFVQKK